MFKTHSTIRRDNTPMAYQTFTHQIWWVVMCYDLVHQIRWAKQTFSGQCDITPMVCCLFCVHSTPQFYSVIYPKLPLHNQFYTCLSKVVCMQFVFFLLYLIFIYPFQIQLFHTTEHIQSYLVYIELILYFPFHN